VNETQSDKLDNLLRLARQLYNAALQQRSDAWNYHHKSLNYYDQANQLKEVRNEIPKFAQLNFSATQDMLRRLDKSFKAFFRRVKSGEVAGFPRFKGRDRFDSITFPTYGDGIKIKGNRLYVQNVGLLKIKMHRVLEGEINTLTIKRECGKWNVVFSDTVEIEPLPVSDRTVGIDVGLESFAVTSDGECIENPRYLREAETVLRVSQRSVSRKKKGKAFCGPLNCSRRHRPNMLPRIPRFLAASAFVYPCFTTRSTASLLNSAVYVLLFLSVN
jgi:putative transposase